MGKLAELEQKRSELDKEIRQFAEQKGDGKDWSDEDKTKFEQLRTDYDETKSQLESLERGQGVGDLLQQLDADRKASNAPPANHLPGRDSSDVSADSPLSRIRVPARARASRPLRVYDREEDAYVAGQVILAGIYKNQKAIEFCRDHGLYKQTMNESEGPKGGFMVPEEMQRNLIRLREERGVFSRFARPWPMASDTLIIPRDLTDVTVYWVGEGQQITESDKTLDGAELIAKKMAALTKLTTEIDEDSVVDIGEMVTRSMAYKMADKIDQAGFNGDGTSTYGGVTGLKNALHANAIQDAVSGNVSAETLDLADWEKTAGKLPEYPGTTNRWFMHKQVYYKSILSLLNAAGGTNGTEISQGQEKQLFGYPVEFVQVMPSAPSTSTIVAYFGDLSYTATLGVRRGMRTQVSLDAYFENDLIGIKSTERIGLTVHERGETDAERPMVALKTAES